MFREVWNEKKHEIMISGAIGLVFSLLSGGILAVVGTALTEKTGTFVLAGLMLFLAMMVWIVGRRVEEIWRQTRFKIVAAKKIRAQAEELPPGDWTDWLDRMEASWRGMGSLQGTDLRGKSGILRDLVIKTNPTNKRDVAKNFLESLADEIRML